MSFARPWLLLLLLALPAWWWLRTRRLGRLAGTPLSDARPAAAIVQRLWLARVPVALRSLCLAAWIVAAAGPRIGAAKAEVRSEGISIVLAVDLSSSMLAEDFTPANRLDVAKQTAIEFRAGPALGPYRPGGVRGTGADPGPASPTTTPCSRRRSRICTSGTLEDGTAIGTGIATAANRLRRAPGKSRVIILLTDGVNNRGTVDPRTAARAAAAFGIRIYTIGVGTAG